MQMGRYADLFDLAAEHQGLISLAAIDREFYARGTGIEYCYASTHGGSFSTNYCAGSVSLRSPAQAITPRSSWFVARPRSGLSPRRTQAGSAGHRRGWSA